MVGHLWRGENFNEEDIRKTEAVEAREAVECDGYSLSNFAVFGLVLI